MTSRSRTVSRSSPRRTTAGYLHCPRCRLTLSCHASNSGRASCPRCLGRSGVASPLFFSPLHGGELRAQPDRTA
jgi:tRNA G26 N,N-dimethylase Trm1